MKKQFFLSLLPFIPFFSCGSNAFEKSPRVAKPSYIIEDLDFAEKLEGEPKKRAGLYQTPLIWAQKLPETNQYCLYKGTLTVRQPEEDFHSRDWDNSQMHLTGNINSYSLNKEDLKSILKKLGQDLNANMGYAQAPFAFALLTLSLPLLASSLFHHVSPWVLGAKVTDYQIYQEAIEILQKAQKPLQSGIFNLKDNFKNFDVHQSHDTLVYLTEAIEKDLKHLKELQKSGIHSSRTVQVFHFNEQFLNVTKNTLLISTGALLSLAGIQALRFYLQNQQFDKFIDALNSLENHSAIFDQYLYVYSVIEQLLEQTKPFAFSEASSPCPSFDQVVIR